MTLWLSPFPPDRELEGYSVGLKILIKSLPCKTSHACSVVGGLALLTQDMPVIACRPSSNNKIAPSGIGVLLLRKLHVFLVSSFPHLMMWLVWPAEFPRFGRFLARKQIALGVFGQSRGGPWHHHHKRLNRRRCGVFGSDWSTISDETDSITTIVSQIVYEVEADRLD